MMPKVLWETTLNPRTRRLLRVEIADQIVTDRVINELMGKDASARFRFIMDGPKRRRNSMSDLTIGDRRSICRQSSTYCRICAAR